MKIVVIGGSGRIGTRLVRDLREEDLRVFEASRSSGFDTITRAGFDNAYEDADIVIDVSNVSSLDGAAALRFFEASTRNLIAAGRRAGIRHHILLSIVGVENLLTSDYFRAKKLQEERVAASGIPFTILRASPFFEFISDVVQEGTAREIPIAPAWVQPIAGEDIANALADAAFSNPFDAILEVAGPQRLRLDEIATEIATAYEDGRSIVPDFHARYLGAELTAEALLSGPDARIGTQRFDDWLRDSLQPRRLAISAN
jgi:uncharacterized protein YbjT (DUF2867 family)